MRAVAANGKVILLGEHGVVYGRPALALGINRGVRAHAKAATGFELTVLPWNVTVTPTTPEPLGKAFAAVIAGHRGHGGPVHIEADVELSPGAGLGCSAALGVAVVRALETAAADPGAQVRALIEASFATHICNRKKISVWFAFWGESRSRPKYMELCGANDRAFSDKLLELCAAIESKHGARLSAATAALAIEGMIDGLWQNFLIGPPRFKRDQAIRLVFELLDSIYPSLATIESDQL